jgi:hypothetical protein
LRVEQRRAGGPAGGGGGGSSVGSPHLEEIRFLVACIATCHGAAPQVEVGKSLQKAAGGIALPIRLGGSHSHQD